jgi:hypothetical protein
MQAPNSRSNSMSSREALEEPELRATRSRTTTLTTTPEKMSNSSTTDTVSPRDEKKKRRFSMNSFHRSRSRPNSIVLPSSNSLLSATPKVTPARELSRVLGEQRSRPHSYHAPVSWNGPDSQLVLGHTLSTPPREVQQPQPSRLGVLPSPAKSLFSKHDRDIEEDVPPMPQIPDKLRSSSGLSHDVLQSVIRYATPPIPGVMDTSGVEAGTVKPSGQHPSQLEWPLRGREETERHQASGPYEGLDQRHGDASDEPPRLPANTMSGAAIALPAAIAQSEDYQQPIVNAADSRPMGRPRVSDDDVSASGHDDEVKVEGPQQRPLDTEHIQTTSTDSSSVHRAAFPPVHLDVSDDENDGNSRRLANPSSLRAPSPKHTTHDVSPLLPAAQLARTISYEQGLAPKQVHLSIATQRVVRSAATPAKKGRFQSKVVGDRGLEQPSNWETELIGNGDISPISAQSLKSDVATLKDEAMLSPHPVWFAKGDLHLPKTRSQGTEGLPIATVLQQPSVSQIDEDLQPRQAEATNAQGAVLTGTPSDGTLPTRVSRAVDEHASDSSHAPWHRDSIAANSTPISSHRSDMRPYRDAATPVAQAPRVVQHGQSAKPAMSNDNARYPVRANGYPGTHGMPINSTHRPQPQSSDLTVPERSKSILSMISSMVSDDGTPLSPSASSAGRSTPSTIRRMHHDTPIRSSPNPAQIPEESTIIQDDNTPNARDDDFDLYADHDGVVKDVRDDNGQPLRVGQIPSTTVVSSRDLANRALPVGAALDDDRPRISEERPMSFISGSADQNGRPQDQVNQAAQQGLAKHRAALEQYGIRPENLYSASISTVYSTTANPQQPPRSALTYEVSGPSNNENHEAVPVKQKSVTSQAPTASDHSQRSPATSRDPQHSTLKDQIPYSVQDVRNGAHSHVAYGQNQDQPAQPLTPAEGQMAMLNHEPNSRKQTAASRDELEFQQRMMALQNTYPRPGGANEHSSTFGFQRQMQQTAKQQDTPVSKPKLSSVFKSFGEKFQVNPRHGSPPLSDLQHFSNKPLPMEPNQDTSYQPGASDPLHTPGRSGREPSYPSKSRMAESTPGGHASTTLQPTDASIDFRSASSPAPTQGTPLHQVPHNGRLQTGQYQPIRAPGSAVQEIGKKKRFSALGNLFGRGGDKKAQKAQRHSTAPPTQASISQRPQQHVFSPQQPGMSYTPPGQIPQQSMSSMHPMSQYASPQTMSPVTPQGAQRSSGHGQNELFQQPLASTEQIPRVQSDEGSAYIRTKQLAEEHQIQKGLAQSHRQPHQVPRTSSQVTRDSSDSQPLATTYGPPSGGYYSSNTKPSLPEVGIYKTSQAARVLAEQQRQQLKPDSGGHRSPQGEAIRQSLPRPATTRSSQEDHYRAQRQQSAELVSTSQDEQQQVSRLQHHPTVEKGAYGASHAAVLRDQQRQQQGQSLRSQAPIDMSQIPSAYRSVSGPTPRHDAYAQAPVSQRHVSSPMAEPQYETPEIPAAYNPVFGVFISPRDQVQLPSFPPPREPTVPALANDHRERHYPGPQMESISPQVSAQSQMPSNNRTHSDASAISVVSPVPGDGSTSLSASPQPDARDQRSRMSSIPEVQHSSPERPWHMDLPKGATEQEIVMARQRQFMQKQFTTQQQAYVDRAAQSPSPRGLTQYEPPVSPPMSHLQGQTQGGGFKELLPRMQSQPATQPAAHYLPMSVVPTGARGPPVAPTSPRHSPMHSIVSSSHSPSFQEQDLSHGRENYGPSPLHHQQYSPPPAQEPHYEEALPDEPPPSYDGPGITHEGMDKTLDGQSLPPITPVEPHPSVRGHQDEPRPRKPSIGILQHPQPASMMATSQRSSAAMGASSLRQQMLDQEEHARTERIKRAQAELAHAQRERIERDAARARARELERSVSGGGRVSSIQSVAGSRNGGQPGWERRGSTSRQVFELPAVEDDEPAMKATSYPGQEWVPPMWTDD